MFGITRKWIYLADVKIINRMPEPISKSFEARRSLIDKGN